MASRKQRFALTRAELRFWETAFVAAELPMLLKSNGKRLNPVGLAHIAAEYADAAVVERRNSRSGGTS